jgi:hypothetical protein
MRKLRLQMQISVDGFVAGPNGEEDWMVRGDKHWQLINDLADSSDTILLAERWLRHLFLILRILRKKIPKLSLLRKW